MKNVKHKIASFMRKNMEKTLIYDVLVKINLLIFHFEKRECKKMYGKKNPDKTFYVIRGIGKEAGLFALYVDALKEINYSLERGWIPIVDLTNGKTQYNEDFPVRGNIWNAWEYYFEQPQNDFTLEDVYQSKNVILSGWRLNSKNAKPCVWDDSVLANEKEIQKVNDFISKYGRLQPDIVNEIKKVKEKYFGNKKNVLGVFVRGTDYLAFKPKGHQIQPPFEDVIKKIKYYLEIHKDIDGIFVETEDESIFQKLKKEFGEMIFTNQSCRIKDYSGEEYIANIFQDKKYERGLEYLVATALLAECKYLVSTRAGGSDVALVMNNNQYADKYIFDLGVY